MSLIIAVNSRAGIVVAADSRATYKKTDNNCSRQHTHHTDNIMKIHPCGKNVILNCGKSYIKSKSMSIQQFLNQFCKKYANYNVCELASTLLREFHNDEEANNLFIVAGYYENIPYIYTIDILYKTLSLGSVGEFYGTVVSGQTEFLKNFDFSFEYKCADLETVIQFAKTGVDITTAAFSFRQNPCVGGPTDVYVLPKNEEPYWYQRKKVSEICEDFDEKDAEH